MSSVVSPHAASAAADQLLVLPWIFRAGFLEREHDHLAMGGKLVLPLPELAIVAADALAV